MVGLKWLHSTKVLSNILAQIPPRLRRSKGVVLWTDISRANGAIGQWIDVSRLPRADFPLQLPKNMHETLVDELIDWILKGERGLLPTEHRFLWVGQDAGSCPVDAVPRRR